MTIETKYNIGDEVWFMWENKVQCSKIKDLESVTIRPVLSVVYELEMLWHDAKFVFKECALYPTKEELLKSL